MVYILRSITAVVAISVNRLPLVEYGSSPEHGLLVISA